MSKFTAENYKSFFAYRNFSELNPKERKELIKFTVEKIREDKGLAAVKFRCKDMERENRGYCSQEKSLFGKFKNHNLVLNSDILYSKRANISYETFNTINHELEHAMQYENNANVELSNDIPEILEQRLNDEHYYAADGDKIVGLFNDERSARFDTQTDYQLYRAQACESDAREAGLQAVEKLRIDNERNGVIDEHIIDYLDAKHADDIVDNREMLSKLGMHSREKLAKEQLSYISEEKISSEQREKVLEYARKKDYEVAQKVLEDDHYNLSEDEIFEKFNSNEEYGDFFETDRYNELKVKDNERSHYKYGNYKWEDDEEGLNNNPDYSSERESFASFMNDENTDSCLFNESLDNNNNSVQENNNR